MILILFPAWRFSAEVATLLLLTGVVLATAPSAPVAALEELWFRRLGQDPEDAGERNQLEPNSKEEPA